MSQYMEKSSMLVANSEDRSAETRSAIQHYLNIVICHISANDIIA